uniref:Fatty acid hydroxylase domain-containing protein n=1 Tax=viral metagenome TaxID=1070528 RepID=A0A6C0C8P2_9ZZZZ
MLDGVIIIVGVMFVLMFLEYLFPDRDLPKVNGWWLLGLSINIVQLIIGLSAYLLEDYLNFPSRLNLKLYVSDFTGGVVAYFIHIILMYWWHYFRHMIHVLWILFHQFHHSPQRVEILTSFYKHPLEMIINSALMILLSYPVLGISGRSSMWLSIFAGFGEFIYHMNLRTPKFLAYFVQSSVNHTYHHRENSRINCPNYGDIPCFTDILNGTFHNAQTESKSGFNNYRKGDTHAMLRFKDVGNREKSIKITFNDVCHILLLILGSLNLIGYIFFSPTLQGIAFASASSPLPFVFSAYEGIETYSLKYSDILVNNETMIDLNDAYSKIEGPYNLRNVYGAMFTYGPLFKNEKLVQLRQDILRWGICGEKIIILPFAIHNASTIIKTFDGKEFSLSINCNV